MTAPTTPSPERQPADAGGGLLPNRRSKAHTVHGHTVGRKYSPTYHSWQAMLARTRYPERDVDQKHVGRGIIMDDRWFSFENFLEDMGERPAGTTLDRIDNNGGYDADNCRWATPRTQARNRRNARLTYETAFAACLGMLAGRTAKEIAAEIGCSESLPREVLKGRCWPDASAAAHEAWRVGQ